MSESPLTPAALPVSVLDAARLSAVRSYGLLDSDPEEEFDDLASLAAQLCGTPIALVSLVDENRQWFKAHLGFEARQTTLGGSVCAHSLDGSGLLVIPDLTKDPRTVANTLVTGSPGLRFFAGAPLRSSDGYALGSLCVIDTVPRPEGLTATQANGLQILAKQVMVLMEMRRAVTRADRMLEREREAGQRLSAEAAALRDREAQWRGLFDRLREGFLVAEVVRDATGAIHDWRYLEVNPAWSELLGVEQAQAVGRTVREVFPGIEMEWVLEFAQVVVSGQAASFTRQVGDLQRWYEGHVFPIEGDRFGVIFLEVTARILADARREALLQLSDTLRDGDDAPTIIREASAIVGGVLGLTRVGYAHHDSGPGDIVIEAEWVAVNQVSRVGRHRIAEHRGLYQAMLGPSPLVIEDVLSDPLTAGDTGHLLALNTRSLVTLPMLNRNRRVATFFAHAAAPRSWSVNELAFLRNVADRVEVAVARARAEEDQAMQNLELSHRLKNTLAMVQAIARQTMKGASDQQAVTVFTDRIQTLSKAHLVLLERNWTTGAVTVIVNSILDRFTLARFDVSGPEMVVGPRATLSLSLVLHELATNAMKYGSLSTEGGRVSVSWMVEDGADGRELVFRWVEHGGPPATAPVINGFGTRLIASGLIGSGGVTTTYAEAGLRTELRCPMREIEAF